MCSVHIKSKDWAKKKLEQTCDVSVFRYFFFSVYFHLKETHLLDKTKVKLLLLLQLVMTPLIVLHTVGSL